MKYVAVWDGIVWGMGDTIKAACEEALGYIQDSPPDHHTDYAALGHDDFACFEVDDTKAADIDAGNVSWP